MCRICKGVRLYRGTAVIIGLDHVLIAAPAGSEERARAFFGDVLGLRELPKPDLLAKRGGVWFACGEQQLHVGAESEFVPSRKGHPAFRVSDIDAVGARLDEAGVPREADHAIPGVRRFYTEDPFGNRLEFTEDQRR